jgi:hypothetical protein
MENYFPSYHKNARRNIYDHRDLSQVSNGPVKDCCDCNLVFAWRLKGYSEDTQ